MRALVIGSEGNIGAPLVRHLRERGHDVIEADIRPGWREGYHVADINHPLDLLPAFDWGPDVVYLLSAMVSRVTCEASPSLAVATNLGGINNVIQLTKLVDARLVFTSTSEVYGPRTDEMREDEPDPRPNNRYGLTKLLGEQLVQYEARHGLDAVILRPFMIYDENETLGDHRSAMIRFATELAAGRPIEVHAGSLRGWLHVSDAVRAFEAAAAVAATSAPIINIGHHHIAPIDILAGAICDNLGADPALIRVVPQPSRMTPVKRPTLDRMRSMLGIVPSVSIVDGVDRVCRKIRSRINAERG